MSVNIGNELIQLMDSACVKAANSILQALEAGTKLKTKKKEDASLVTSLDILAHDELMQSLRGKYKIVSEEDKSTHALIASSEPYFLVDPIDGTTSFKRFLLSENTQVGYGPLIGFVEAGCLMASSFYNLPQRTLYTALRGQGAYKLKTNTATLPALTSRKRLRSKVAHPLEESALLFYPGSHGELRAVEKIKSSNLIENIYRFGGFANDCSRLANAYEQLLIQFSVHAWDFSATLFPIEAGLNVIIDPFGAKTPFAEWKIQERNPVMIGESAALEELIRIASESE